MALPTIEGGDPTDRDEHAADTLTFGVKIEPRGIDPGRWVEPEHEAPGVADQLGRAMEQSTFGIVGTYRF
jgi:hypothetical protein